MRMGMMVMSELSKCYRKSAVVFLIMMLVSCVVLSGCGGGSGSDGGGNPPPPAKEAVAISGKVEIRDRSAPLSGAECRFVDSQGGEQASATSDEAGQYTLEVPVDMDGDIRCTPSGFSNLALSTYCSTKGLSGGDVLEAEDVTIVSTVTAQVLASEAPTDPVARKTELMEMIASGQDPDYDLVAQLSADLYTAMLQNHLDIGFSGGISGPADSDGGGISGQVGTGVGQTPIAGAQCRFMVDDDLGQGRKVLRNAVLADFFDDGRLSRPDLQAVQEQVNDDAQGREQAIIDAFARVFPNGIGQAYAAISNENGNYALAIPPDTPGYVCCTPPDQDQLVLEAYVPARNRGETLTAQDVNPATTVHSVQIASRLDRTATDIQATKDNYLAGIAGMEVQMLQDNDGVSGFQLRTGTAPADRAVGLAAFCGTALFNSLYHNQLNADFSAVLADFFQQQGVDPAFLTDQGIGADDAQTISEVVGAAMTQAASSLDIQLTQALSTARINVTVLETPDGPPLPDFLVSLSEEDLDCTICYNLTDTWGEALLDLSGLSNEPRDITIIATDQGNSGEEIQVTVQIMPLVVREITMVLNPEGHRLVVQGGAIPNDGNGTVISDTGDIHCAIVGGQANDCEAILTPGTSLTLTAVPPASSTFAGWQGSACSGTEPTCTVTMDQDHNVTALFSPRCAAELYDVWPAYSHIAVNGAIDGFFNNYPESCGELSADTSAEWITLIEENGYLDFVVSENLEDGPRAGTVLYGEHPLFIAQDGQQCDIADYGLAPISASFESVGGTGTIQVHAPSHCPWQAVAEEDWIAITSDPSGANGDGTVTYSVSENTGDAGRAGIISIAGTHYMVVQADSAGNPPLALIIQGEGEGTGWVTYSRDHLLRSGQIQQESFTCNINGAYSSGKCNIIDTLGSQVELIAGVPEDGDGQFSNWTGDSCLYGAYPECDLTMDQMHVVGAFFVDTTTMPDLTSQGIHIADSILPIGTYALPYVHFTIQNIGRADAEAFSVQFYISRDSDIDQYDTLLTSAQSFYNGLSAGGERTVDIQFYSWIPTSLSPGPAYLGYRIDDRNSVREIDETNNSASVRVELVSADSNTTLSDTSNARSGAVHGQKKYLRK